MHQNSFQSIRKKAFRKACSKVHRTQDSVSYRGGELTPEFLRRSGLEPPPLPLLSGATLSSSPTPTPATFRSRPRGGQASKHLRVLSWNAGHLGVQQWAEIRTWLREDSSSVCDVLVLQETHWNETAEFDVEGWHCISSAKKGAARAPKKKAAPGQRPEMKAASQQDPQLDTSRADGVMVLLSKRIPANQVRWREIRKGRLLQVIFPWMGTRVHLAAVYQHAWSSKKTIQQNKEDRAKLLGEISSLIRSIPCRNTFLLAGDFNARLSPHEGLIGPCSTAAEATNLQDESLQALVTSHGLIALNTWSSGQGHTFIQNASRSQIDFFFTTAASATGKAKQASPQSHLRLGQWKRGGHLPLLVQLRPTRHWNLPQQRQSPPQFNKEALEAAVRNDLPVSQRMKDWVQQRLSSDPDQVNAGLMEAAATYFPRSRSEGKPESAQHRATLRMWHRVQHIRSLHEESVTTLADLEQSLEDLSTWHKQALNLARKERHRAFQAEVDEACAHHDSYIAHKTLKKLRPWTPQVKAQLQGPDGNLLDAPAELQLLRNHVETVFAKHPPLEHAVSSLPVISPRLLSKHIGSIRPHKAVPQGSAPAAAWRLCSDLVGEALTASLQELGHRPGPAAEMLRSSLKDADLCFIPKPNKPATKPSNLRPLGIIRPDGKGLAGACRDLLAPITETYLRDLPQFAYQPKRGLSDALGRVVRHVRLVRQSCQDARRTRHQIQQSQVRPPLVGGVCFALDLSQAFDMVSRRDLLDTLRAAGADSALIDLVAALHAESTYSFRTQGQEGQVVSTTGIKQGCKLAPTLFSMLTGTIFRELIALVGVQAVVDYLTGYADDLTVHREIHSMEDLGRAHALIEQLLALVRKHGFAVNPSKCTMMVKLEGTQAQRALRRFTYWRTAPDGQRQKMWRLGQAKSHEGFPSVTSFKYLGVMLSYGNNFEKATLKHRLQEGNAKLQRVRRFVHNRRTAGPRSRLHIWHSTVWATVSSGLVDVGLTEETAALLRAWHAKKIRAVLNCPAHLTHKSTSDLYRAHDIVDPVLKLQKRHANRVKRLLKRHRLSQTGDVALAPPALEQALFLRGQYQSVIAQLDAAATPAAPASLETCPTCNQQFETKVGLRTHIARKHPETVQRYIPRTFSHLLSVDGLPHCAACRKRFPQMKGLKDHLLSGACSAPAELRALDDQAQPTTAPTSSLSGLHRRAGSRASLQGTSGVLSHMWFLDP